MATPQTVIHGTARPGAALVPAALASLALLQLWELPRLAATHGGPAFVGAWLLGLLLLGLPLLLLEMMLGKRSRRAPLAGLAVLTREADAPRGWRFAAWGGAVAIVLALAALALVAGGNVNFLARDAGLLTAAAPGAAPALPLGAGTLLILGAGFCLLAPALRGGLQLGGLGLVLVLLLVAAVAGAGILEVAYPGHPLSAADWREALRLSLLSGGGGFGVLWLAGMRLEKGAPLGRLALAMLVLQALLGVLLLLALAPFVVALTANAAGGPDIVPTGPAMWAALGALLLLALLALPLLAEPLLLRLAERSMARLPAVVGLFVAAALLAEGVWLFGEAAGLARLLQLLSLLLLAVLACLSAFTGWAMKISHARKELALPAEGLYNVWRVAVRLVVPLAILWILVRSFL